MKSRCILLVHRAFAQADQPGGTRHLELSRELIPHHLRVEILTSKVPHLQAASGNLGNLADREELEPGITVIRCSSGRTGKSPFARISEMFGFMFQAFWAGLRVRPVDLVWGTSPTLFQAFAAALLAKAHRKPLLLEIRDIWPDALVDIGALKNPAAIALSRALARWMYRQAAAIVINSPGFRDHLLAAGIPAERIHLVPNGVDTRMFNPDADPGPTRTRLGWTGRFVVLYSGAHGMANDLDTVLDAAALLRDRPEVLVAFLGDGPVKAQLQARARDLGLDQVVFLEACPKQEMPLMLAAADACIAHLKPSAMQAMVYPNKVFDYMAAARPTILGIGGVIRAVMDEAEGGLWVPCGDAPAMAAAIRILAVDPERGRAMGRRARAYVEAHFQRQALVRPLLTALRACGLDLPA